MRRILLLLIAIITSANVFSQAPPWLWAKGVGSSGYEIGKSLSLDVTGNIYSTGWFEGTVDFDPGSGVFNLISAGNEDIFILKLDNNGNFIWAKRIGGINNDGSFSIAHDASGNFYIAGYFEDMVDFDPNAGTFNLTAASATWNDIFISKYDSSGNLIWAKAIGGQSQSNDYATSIAIAQSGDEDIYITGRYAGMVDFDPGPGIYNLNSVLGVDDIFVCRLDSAGNFIWAKSLGGTGGDEPSSITLDISGNVYTTGDYIGAGDFDPGPGVFNLTAVQDDNFISKLDSAGNFVWAKSIGGPNNENSLASVVDDSGNVYMTGYFTGTIDADPGPGIFNLASTGSVDSYIVKLDANGNFNWAKRIGGTVATKIFSIARDETGGDIYITGEFSGTTDFDPGAGVFNVSASSSNGFDVFVSRWDSSGNFVWVQPTGGGGGCTNENAAFSLKLDVSDNIYVTGFFRRFAIAFGSTVLINSTSNCTTWDAFIAKLGTVVGIDTKYNFDDVMVLFPNPAASELVVSSSEFGDDAELAIYNVLGEKCLTLNPSPKGEGLRIDVSSLPAGLYFVRVGTDAGIKAAKFVKE